MLFLESLGFVINKQKFQLLSTQTIQYLGFLGDSREMKIRLTDEKACSIDHNSFQEGQRERIPVNKRVGQADWQDDSNLPAVFPAPLGYLELQCQKNHMLRRFQSFETSVKLTQEALPRVRVGNQEESGEQMECDDPRTRSDYGDRRFIDGVGSSVQRRTTWRTMVSDGAQKPYQLPGTTGS